MNLKASYKHYIPDEWIIDFTNLIANENVDLEIYKDEGNTSNFTGPEPADIVLFFLENPHSIFLAPAAYDLLKSGIKALWNKLKSLNSKKKSQDDKNILAIRFQDSENRQININIEGTIDRDSIEDVISQSLELLKGYKQEGLFNKSEIVDEYLNMKVIEFWFNNNSKSLEPVNVKKNKEEFEAYLREVYKILDS